MPYAIPASVGLKSLVWYPPEAFGQAGYQVPETWDEMMALSQQMVDNEQVPWCLAMGSEMTRVDSTGWVGTDWVEDIMLRTAGPDAYDAWTRGDLPFNSDQVRRAWELYGQVLFTEGFVLEPPEDILTTPFWDALAPLLEDPPACWMHRQASFAAPWVASSGGVLGQDATVFGFPRIDPGMPQAALVGNDWAVVSHVPANPRERSELGKVIRFIASPRFGTHALAAAGNGWLSAHRRFNLNQYPDEWTTLQAEYVRSAQRDGGLREDGSDQLPDVVDEAFFAGIRDYITGTRSLDQILTDIDTAWPE
jgi:alpha-glucoside transport system substrate-binding protein